MKALKFGGTSVRNAASIKQVYDILLHNLPNNQIVVVSALGGTTDQLLEAGITAAEGSNAFASILQNIKERHIQTIKALYPIQFQSGAMAAILKITNQLEEIVESIFVLKELSPSAKDKIVSFGEILSSTLIAGYIQTQGHNCEWVDTRKLIITDDNFGNAKPLLLETNHLLQDYFNPQNNSKSTIWLMPGFVSTNANGQATTLGRGGSDYTAAIVAAAINSSVLEIWTDVPGMMTADPNVVSTAKTIPHLSYKEAMELSHFGAKVLYPPTVIPAMNAGIDILIKNTFAPQQEGTLISEFVPSDDLDPDKISGISCIKKANLLTIEGPLIAQTTGFSEKLFGTLAINHINPILITQASSEHAISVAVNSSESVIATQALSKIFEDEIAQGKLIAIKNEHDLSIIALVGDKMQSHPGISGRMFGALGRNGVNIRAIAQGSSERNISCIIAAEDTKKAMNVLHEVFFEGSHKQLNVFIVGTGNVGSRLLDQIRIQQQFLLDRKNIQLRVMGLMNSRQALVSDYRGIDIHNWHEILPDTKKLTVDEFADVIIQKNLRNSILVDITANEEVANIYPKVLRKSISVVACNKIANSSSYDYYQELQQTAKEFNANLYFETNVGAGLPVISTIQDLIDSGDEVLRIRAVLSGTLNFVFNNYYGSRSFSEIVKLAKKQGYTEPDPRLDLSGKDVMRKLLILTRVCGYETEMNQIEVDDFLPASTYEGDVDHFFAELEKHESYFKEMYDHANANGKKLKYIAEFEDGKMSVGLKAVESDSDFFHLYGKDNIIQLYTHRYGEQPLVIKGAGAGSEVTASGIFADLIKSVN